MWDARQQVRRGPVGGRAAGPDGATAPSHAARSVRKRTMRAARSARSSGASARRMREMNKSHWAESYIGRPYVEGRARLRRLRGGGHARALRPRARAPGARGRYARVGPPDRGAQGHLRGARRAGGARNYGGAGGARIDSRTGGARNYGDAARGRRRADGGRRSGGAAWATISASGAPSGASLTCCIASRAWARSFTPSAISTAARSCSKASTDGDNRPVARPFARGK